MRAHETGVGFGVIAQALWLTRQLDSDSDAFNTPEELFLAILRAKESGIYTAFFPEGTENVPTSWGQFKKALSDKKNNLGIVVSDKDQDNGDNSGGNGDSQVTGNVNGQGNSNKDNNSEKGNHGNNGDKGNGKNR